MKQIYITIAVVILFMGIGFYVGWNVKPEKKCPEITQSDTTITNIPQPKDTTKPEIEIKYVKVPVIDTIFVEIQGKDSLGIDTTWTTVAEYIATNRIEKPDVYGVVRAHSKIPFDKDLYFTDSLAVKYKIVTNNYEVEKPYYKANKFSIYGGLGTPLNDEPNIRYILGASVSPINFKYLEWETRVETRTDFDEFDYSAETLLKIKF